jgi:hypothetical protein
MDTIQDVVSAEPETGAQPDTAQPDEATMETQLAAEINTLWSDHVRLSADRRATSKELRLIRMKLAESLDAMKSLLCRPGRGGQWRSWLRERGIPRSTADGLCARYGETLAAGDGNVPSQAIPEPGEADVEKLAKSVWQRFGKLLTTNESVILFIDRIAELSGVGHERRSEGLMIFNPVPKAVDGVTGNEDTTEAAAPAPHATEGDGKPADLPTADLGPQLPDNVPATAYESPASAPAIDSAPQPSGGGPAGIEQPAAEVAAAPLAADQVAAVADGGSGCVV